MRKSKLNLERSNCTLGIMPTQTSSNPTRPLEMRWKKGTDPREGKWPGLRQNQIEKYDGMEITWDVAVTLRDEVKLYVDIFRPEESDGKLPIILTWSPYGKHGPKTFAIFPGSGVPEGSVSKYAVWEGPDPVYWTKKGYAIINADTRGSWGSEGNCEILGPQEGQDGYDVVEWAAALPWSNGRIGLAGVSYLAISQWRIAELNPPHLECIQPFGGFTDVYRDYSHHGGVPETNFVKFMEWSCRCSLGMVEDWVLLHKEHNLFDEYQASKRAKLSQIKVPAYVVADWGDQGLHTRGTLIGFTEMGSKEKWLEVHANKKWQYYYSDPSLRRQEAFFQKFLKDQPSEVDTWSPVTIEVRDRAYEAKRRNEMEWPLARTEFARKYLDNAFQKLVDDLPSQTSLGSYNSQTLDDGLEYVYTFAEETELTGTMRLRLWVSAEHEDMDLFVRADKLDCKGAVVPFIAMTMIDDGPLALGWLRASHRELDIERSKANQPWLLHHRELPLRPGEVVPVDIEIIASSTRFRPQESLKIVIQGNDTFRYDRVQIQLHEDSVNRGKHFIYTGGIFDSYLTVPRIAAAN